MPLKMKNYLIILFGLLINLNGICQIKTSSKIEIIDSFIIGKNFHYNPEGFLNTPYGRVSILKKSIFINGKLESLWWNRANGFLHYSLEDLKRDTKLYKSFKIDSIYKKTKKQIEKYKTRINRNDTLFVKKEDKVLIIKSEFYKVQ